MIIHNSIGVAITDSWLSDNINDAEISIDNYSIFRSDRCDRIRGGVCLYLRNDLGSVTGYTYCNNTVETLIVKCKKLDTLFIVVYGPPNTSNELWNDSLYKLEEAINMLQAHRN